MPTSTQSNATSASGSTAAPESRGAPETWAGPDAGATISDVLRDMAQSAAHADFLRLQCADHNDVCHSYESLFNHACGFARQYEVHGIEPGDRIAVLLPHSFSVYAAFFGGILCGAVPSIWATPSHKVSHRDYASMLDHQLRLTDPAGIVADDATTALIREHDSPPLKVLRAASVEPASYEPGYRASHGDVAFLQYSSGTTGNKKGVAITHRALLWQIRAYAEAIQLDPSTDRIVSWLPLYHDMGLIACLFLPFMTGTPLIAMSPFDWVRDPAMWLRAVSDYRATLSWLPNFAYSFMAQNVSDDLMVGCDLSSLRGVVNCSEPIHASSHDQFMNRFSSCGLRRNALCASYALAENTFAVTSGGFGERLNTECVQATSIARDQPIQACEFEEREARIMVSSGRALVDTQLRILDSSGELLPERTLGEIAFLSPCMLDEYHDDPARTEHSLRDGWFHSGDLGYVSNGHLFIIGRSDDLIIVRGRNIMPQDIEAIVNDVEGVVPGRCATFGIHDDDAGTQALVVLVESQSRDSDARHQIAQTIRSQIHDAIDVSPVDVRVLNHLTLRKSTSGKISRSINRDRYMSGEFDMTEASAVVHESHDGDLIRMRSCIARVLAGRRGRDVESLHPTDALISSGLIDSLGFVGLLQSIETSFDVRIPASLIRRCRSLDSIAEFVSLVRHARTHSGDPDASSSSPSCREDIPLLVNTPAPRRMTRGAWSWFYQSWLRAQGATVGHGLRVRGRIMLRLDGDPRNLEIGNNVTIMPGVDLKIRESGRIILHDNTVLDTNARLVAANNATLEIGAHAQVAMGSIINAGADVIIGRHTATAGYCTIVASEHQYMGFAPIMSQGYDHEPVYIGEDVWIGTYTFIGRGARIGRGAVIGAQSHVRGFIPAMAVAMGQPARVIRYRNTV